jgi:hypothetical protein
VTTDLESDQSKTVGTNQVAKTVGQKYGSKLPFLFYAKKKD